MKKIVLFIGFVAAGAVLSKEVSAQAGPKMTFETTVVDYGEVEYGGPRERVWKFKNSGKEPLIITSAQGSCGCTVPSYPKEPIMPGATGEIKINYDTNRPGDFNKLVTIMTNEPEGENQHVITVKGKVKAAPAAVQSGEVK